MTGGMKMENREFIFVVTHSYDAVERAAAALQLATNMAAFDAKIDFFLMNEGVLLAKKGFAEQMTWQHGFSPIKDLINSMIEDFGAKFYICASCVEPYGLKGAELIKNAEIKPGSYLGELLMQRQNVTF
jgi:predicted peroxiredoxin